jgi:hypothetical protein
MEQCTLDNLHNVELVKFKNGQPYYVGADSLTNAEFSEWAATKSEHKLLSDHILQDRVDLFNEMIAQGIYVFNGKPIEIDEQ